MTTSISTMNGEHPPIDFSIFRAFIEQRRPALVERVARDFQRFSRAYRDAPEHVITERINGHIDAYLNGLETPDQVPQYVAEEIGPIIQQQMEIASLLHILSIFRQHFIDVSLEALALGVAHTGDALKSLMSLTDTVALLIADLYHGRLYEGIYRQADELRATKNRLEQSILRTPLASIEWDNNGTILFWNPSAERMFGWTAEEAVGRNLFDLLLDPNDQFDRPRIMRSILSDMGQNGRDVNITKDGKHITCSWYNATLRDESGEVVGVLSQAEDITEQIAAEAERQSLQQQVIEAQAAMLRELSTPLIPISDRVVAMPLIGSIDSTRAQQVIEELLDGVGRNHARVAILDITGVSVVDTQVANALLRAAQAVKLLGATVVLTGIRPEVAQTLIGLGLDMRGLVTRSTLQMGIAYALQHA